MYGVQIPLFYLDFSFSAGFSFRSDSRFLGMVCTPSSSSATQLGLPPSGSARQQMGLPTETVLTYSQTGHVFVLQSSSGAA